MATLKSWTDAARPRTLPLALSGIFMGCGLSWFSGEMDVIVSVLAVVTATLIQIFSNFANDYGDGHRGTDNHNRLGPVRTIQSGKISKKEMETGMFVIGGASILTGIIMLYLATWHASKTSFFIFLMFGILSIAAAYFYTAGKKSYGYIGLGDLFVFLFFGLLPVAGVYYLNTKMLPADIFLPSMAIGLFSAGVLNLNNMRDIVNDKNSGKITIPVQIGVRESRIYHSAMILGGWFFAIAYSAKHFHSPFQLFYLLLFPLFLSDLIKIHKIRHDRALDPFLKRLSLATLAFTLLFCLSLTLFAA